MTRSDPEHDYALSLLIAAGTKFAAEYLREAGVSFYTLTQIISQVRGWGTITLGTQPSAVSLQRPLEDLYLARGHVEELQDIRRQWGLPPLMVRMVAVREEGKDDG